MTLLVHRLIPHPVLSVTLLVVWLLLTNTVSVAHVVLGAALGIVIPKLTVGLFPERLRPVRWGLALRLLATFLWDIVVANVVVARLILSPQLKVRPGFMAVPLDLANPYAIATLAGMITMTPGTVSVEVSPDHRTLWVHGLNLTDRDAVIAQVKARYEKPLKELFE